MKSQKGKKQVMNNPIRILLVDDSPYFLDAAREFLQFQEALTVLDVASDEQEALAKAVEGSPDVVLLDLNLARSSGLELIPLFRKELPDTKIIVLTMMNDEGYRAAALQAGADDFVRKSALSTTLVSRILNIMQRDPAPVPAFAEPVLMEFSEVEPGFERLAEHLPDLIYRYEFSPKRGFTYVSPAATAITGYTPEEHYADPDLGFKLVHPDDRHILLEVSEGKIAAQNPLVLRWIHKDGRIFWTEQHNVSIYDDSGTLVAMEGVARDITGLRQSQDSLRNSEKRFRALIENSADGILLVDGSGMILFESPAVTRLLGFTTQERLGMSIFEYIHPEDLTNINQLFSELVAEPGSFGSAQLRFRHKDGSWRWIEGTGSNLLAEDGVNAFVANYRDITERKLADEKLRESEDRYRDLVENSQELICTHDLDGTILSANAAATKMLGYSLQDILRMNIRDILTPETRPQLERYLGRLKRHGSVSGLMHIVTASGEERIWEYNNTLRRDGVIQPVARGMARDVTERELARRALQENEDRFASVIESAMDAVISLDHNQDIVLFNSAAERMFGCPASEAIGGSIERFIPIRYRHTHRGHVSSFGSNGETSRSMGRLGTIHGLRGNGEEFPIEASISQTVLSGKKLYTVILRDITERLEREAALRQSEEKYRRLTENASDIIFRYDLVPGMRLTYINPAVERITGYTPEECLADPNLMLNMIRPEDLPLMAEYVSTRTPPQKPLFMGWIAKDGTLRWMESTLVSVIDESGQLVAVEGITRDMTEHKRVEDALIRAERRYRGIFENTREGIFQSIPGEGRFIEVNPAMAEIFGYDSPLEMLSSVVDIPDQIYADSAGRVEFILQLQQKGFVERYELNMRRKDGSEFWVSTNSRAVRNPQGDILYLEGTVVDITERKRNEAELRASEERFRALFESSPVSIWEQDFSAVKLQLDGLRAGSVSDLDDYLLAHPEFISTCIGLVRVTDVNQAALKLYDAHSKADLLGSLEKTFPMEALDGFKNELLIIGNGGHRYQSKSKLLTLQGRMRDISITWQVVPGYEETYAKVLVSLIDITEQKLAEDKVGRQVLRLKALRDIDRAITSTFDMEISLNSLLAHTISLLSVDAAAILLVNPVLSRLEYAAGQGFRTAVIESTDIHLGEGYAGRAAMQRHIVQVHNLAHAPEHRLQETLVEKEGFVSYTGIPLIAKGTVVGVLEAYHRNAFEADSEWLDFFESLADQAAVAIDNAQSYQGMQRSNIELGMAYDATITGWSLAMDLRDKETAGHTQRVTELTLRLAELMGLSPSEQTHIRRGALLHDIGKIGVPDAILLKPDKLTTEEWMILKQHPTFARDMLSEIVYLRPAIEIPYCHHEKWDGTGYPQGLIGEQIPLPARIFAVVDVWDALTSDRPYRPAWTREDTMQYIREQSGSHFDPNIVEAFLYLMANEPGEPGKVSL